MKWTKQKFKKMTKEQLQNLPIEEFHAIALKQSEFYPDLNKVCDYQTIIDSFYDFYHRKRNDELDQD